MARILIIEDDPDLVELMKTSLSQFGHQVYIAMDAFAGMTVAAKEIPDLITLDYNMPAGNGGIMHNRIRKNASTKDIPIIFLSQIDRTQLPPAMLKDQNIRLFKKPLDMTTLNNAILELLKK